MLRRTFALASFALALSLPAATDATAAGQRSFVSGSGVDAGTCTPAVPCRSFGYAITQTNSGGEVIVLDSAGYGPVAITKSVSIIAPAGVYAGITVPASGTGVTIATAGIKVALRGLTINSTGASGYGIRMTNGDELVVDNCVVSNFADFNSGIAVSIETAAIAKIAGTVISDSSFGVVAGFGVTMNITNSQVINSIREGIEINGGAAGTTTNVFIDDTLATGIGALSYCIDNFATSGATGNITATRVTVTTCQNAITSEPSGTGTVTVSNSMVTGSLRGFYQTSGTFNSLGNNHVNGNTVDKAGTITTIGSI